MEEVCKIKEIILESAKNGTQPDIKGVAWCEKCVWCKWLEELFRDFYRTCTE